MGQYDRIHAESGEVPDPGFPKRAVSGMTVIARNEHERRAWNRLVALGATPTEIGGKPALDVRTVRLRSAEAVADFADALIEVAGRSGAVRRHVDRQNRPVFVVTDDEAARPSTLGGR
jgi:hypothetical protein